MQLEARTNIPNQRKTTRTPRVTLLEGEKKAIATNGGTAFARRLSGKGLFFFLPVPSAQFTEESERTGEEHSKFFTSCEGKKGYNLVRVRGILLESIKREWRVVIEYENLTNNVSCVLLPCAIDHKICLFVWRIDDVVHVSKSLLSISYAHVVNPFRYNASGPTELLSFLPLARLTTPCLSGLL